MSTTSRDDRPMSPFAMTCPRLSSLRQVVIALGIFVTCVVFSSRNWKRIEPFNPCDSYRVPHQLSEDYWIYRRLIETAVRNEQILVIGDSVVWGEYVVPKETISAKLNAVCKDDIFVNGGLSGLHPLALDGVLRLHGTPLRNQRLLVHCNPLWFSSRERDLSTDLPQAFNHPDLIPQFGAWPRLWRSPVPAYQRSLTERCGVATTRRLEFRLLANHIKQQYFGGMAIPQWTLEHPYESVLAQITFEMEQPSTQPRHASADWTQQRIPRQDFDWVDLDRSQQWQAFRRAANRLKAAGNRLCVLVGPLNEHLMFDESRQHYQEIVGRVTEWLSDHQIDYVAFTLLPSDQYGDASHPLAAGYERLVSQLMDDEKFCRLMLSPIKQD